MAVNPEFWMSGKLKSFVKSPDENMFNDSARYSYKASVNIEIEESLDIPFGSKLNLFEDSRDHEKSLQKSYIAQDNKHGADYLFYQFLDIVEAYNSQEQVFEMINSFVDGCVDTLENTPNIGIADKAWLETEKNTWRLIYALYQNRLRYVNEELTVNPEDELNIMKNFFQNNNSIRECQLVVDWLEECAAFRVDHSGQPKLSHFMDKTVAWENTLQQLQINTVAYSTSRPLVSSMDPDAPQRQKKQIHDLDIEDEMRLLEQVFLEIRCGRLNKAIEICSLCGHKWRAVILQGWMLFNDPNYKCSDDSVISAFGNPNRDIWRMCAWQLTEKSNTCALWKAILSVFCGNLSILIPFCKNWEDLLWAYMKIHIDVKVEEEIRTVSSKTYASLPESYWNFRYSIDEIFEELAGFNDNVVRIEACKPERIIQRMIVTNRIPELIVLMADWCAKDNVNPHLVRMAAHIVLCLRLVGFHYEDQRTDDILRSYVNILMKTNDPKLVAYYTAALSEDDQVKYYSEFLENIDDENERIKCLEAAEMCHLHIEAITKRVVQVIRNKPDDETEPSELAMGITKEDQKKISALDLMMHYTQQRNEAVWETNALIRYFLGQRHVQAANYAFCKIPENSIEIILHKLGIDEATLHTKPELVPSKIYAGIREYFCYKVYLDAEVKFADWFHTFHKMEPAHPHMPSDSAQFTQKVAYEHQLAQYQNEHSQWKTAVEDQAKIAKSHLYNVLLFPDGGWLEETRYFDDAMRINQMNALRKLYIPKIVILLHTILHSMELYDECFTLVEIITSEDQKLYEAYSKQDLGEILKKICDSSVCFLKCEKDPWGLSLSA